MPFSINCPKCQKKYQLGDEYYGKSIRCQVCKTAFRIPDKSGTDVAGKKPAATVSSGDRDKLAKLGIQPNIVPNDDLFSSRPPANVDPLGNHIVADPGFAQIDPARFEPKKEVNPNALFENQAIHDSKSLQSALVAEDINTAKQVSVALPAFGMMGLASLHLILHVVGTVISIVNNGGPPPPREGSSIDEGTASIVFWIAVVLIPMLQATVLFGAIGMANFRSYGLAMTACIICVIPICSPLVILGIPFGIMGLITLNLPGVKKAFGD